VSTQSLTGESPLSLAIKRGYEDICHTLCTNGADVSLRYTMPYNPHRLTHSTGTQPDLTTVVPSTVADSTTQDDDNTSVGSALSDTDVDALDLLAQADRLTIKMK
jgi:ankyrin repeat protein